MELHVPVWWTTSGSEDPVCGGDGVSNGWTTLAQILGWTAFVLWSISFYPQVFTNFRRKAVTGLSFDFELYNIMGFSFLTVYNAFLLYNDTAIDEYKQGEDNPNHCAPQVAPNDFAFALHASVLTLVHITQICIYDRGNQKVSWLALTLFSGFLLGAIIYGICVASGVGSLLDLLYYLSYVKLFLTFIKYCPQVYMNWYRKSTVGWNVFNVLFDFTGGWLSLGQLLIDCWQDDNWEGITGNPVKFFLSLFSILFDIIFMVQHYILYRDRRDPTVLYKRMDGAEDDDESAKLVPTVQPSHSHIQSNDAAPVWLQWLGWFTTQTRSQAPL